MSSIRVNMSSIRHNALYDLFLITDCLLLRGYRLFLNYKCIHVIHNNNIIKYTIVSANTFKSFWLHVSTALRPSSGQHTQINCLQSVYVGLKMVAMRSKHVAKDF